MKTWTIAAATGNMNGEDEVVGSGYLSETEMEEAVRQLRTHGKDHVRNAIFYTWAEENGQFVEGSWQER